MEKTQADFGIIGEGEAALPELLDKLERGENILPSGNLMVGSKRGKTENGKSHPVFISDWFSDIDLKIDFTPYKERGAYSIQTKRGCSHGCIYCTYPLLEGRAFRTRNPADIVDEIEQAHGRLGDVMFEFVDSTFNDPRGHAEDICREIIRRKLKVRLRTMGINPRNATENLFGLMMEAGFVQIDATPDTASPAMLKNLGKGFELGEVRGMAAMIRKFNIPTMWFFLFGGPGENVSTFNETLNFIDEQVSPDDLVYMAAGLRVYPGTPLEKTALLEGLVKPGQSLLYPPLFYYSREIPEIGLVEMIRKASDSRVNCVYSIETRPPAGMLQEAHQLREDRELTEPMFRTLLRIRKEWKAKGLL